MRILLHTRTPPELDWAHRSIELVRLPVVGECIALTTDSGAKPTWHRVRLVVHLAGNTEHEAEVYCERLSDITTQREAWATSEATAEPHDPAPLLLTLPQAAKAAQVSAKTIRRLVQAGRLKASDFGTRGRRSEWRMRHKSAWAGFSADAEAVDQWANSQAGTRPRSSALPLSRCVHSANRIFNPQR